MKVNFETTYQPISYPIRCLVSGVIISVFGLSAFASPTTVWSDECPTEDFYCWIPLGPGAGLPDIDHGIGLH